MLEIIKILLFIVISLVLNIGTLIFTMLAGSYLNISLWPSFIIAIFLCIGVSYCFSCLAVELEAYYWMYFKKHKGYEFEDFKK